MLATLTAAAHRFEPSERVGDGRDAKDNKYLEVALAAGASVIVSSDDDPLVLDPWTGIRILTPARFVHDNGADRRPGPAAWTAGLIRAQRACLRGQKNVERPDCTIRVIPAHPGSPGQSIQRSPSRP